MRKSKKLFAVLLSVMMVLCLMPAMAFAAFEGPQTYVGETATLTLEGESSVNGCDGAIFANSGAQLTINGDGSVNAEQCDAHDGYAMAVWANGANTKVVINGGTYTNEPDEWTNDRDHVDLIYASAGATIEINGGNFQDATPKWTLNCKDNTNSKIIVKGGAFYQFNPAQAEVGAGEVVVADGYEVVQDGDWYKVVPHKAVKVEAKDATCTEDGNLEYWYCEGCGKYFDSEEMTNEMEEADTVIPAIGHHFEGGVCTVCGAEDPDYNPGENGEPTTPPTDNPNPPAGGTTDDPADTNADKDAPQADKADKADKDTPKTGDATSALPFVLLVTSLAAAGSLIALRKREE